MVENGRLNSTIGWSKICLTSAGRSCVLTFKTITAILTPGQRARTLYCNRKPRIHKEDNMQRRMKMNDNFITRKQGVIVLRDHERGF